MNLVAAVDSLWGIGKGNDLLYHISEDMKFFRQLTVGNYVVCGRKTLESFPDGKPLPNRCHYVLTSSDMAESEDLVVVHSLDELEREMSNANN